MHIEIETRALKAAVLAVPTKDVREYLTGVCLEITGHQIIAVGTNGHWLFAARVEHDEAVEDTTLIIPKADVEQALKGHKDETIALTRLTNGEWRLGRTIFKPIDAKYPDWRRVVPKKPPSGEASDYSPQYIAASAKALAVWNRIPVNGFASYVIYQDGLNGAVAQGADLDGFCVVMPMRRPKEARADPDVKWALKSG